LVPTESGRLIFLPLAKEKRREFGPKIKRPEKSGIKEGLAFLVWAFLMQKIRRVFGGVV
jgi:hypothetical protein